MIILSADLDRTLLPNGKEDYDNTLPVFFDLIKKKNITLIYATGRNIELFEKAKNKYKIQNPDYLIGEVGTVIYKKTLEPRFLQNLLGLGEKEKMVLDKSWLKYLDENTKNWNFKRIIKSLKKIEQIKLQEKDKLNNYKVSYYLENIETKEKVLEFINKIISTLKIDANIIFSIDPIKKIGLVDILPKLASKASALNFLRSQIDAPQKEIIYCGDSGNDIIPLTSGYKSIIVKNSRQKIKDLIFKINKDLGYTDNLYIAKGTEKLNGNYVSGILEGLVHFGIIDGSDLDQNKNK